MMTVSNRQWLALAIVMALAAIGGAWASELGFGYVPCKLCLLQRWPYYIGIPLLLAALFARTGRFQCGFAAAAAVAFVIGAGLGSYHALVEWGVFLGPADCGGRADLGTLSVGDLQKSLGNIHVVACNAAPLRVAGLSFAGWNAVLSALVAAMAVLGALRRG